MNDNNVTISDLAAAVRSLVTENDRLRREVEVLHERIAICRSGSFALLSGCSIETLKLSVRAENCLQAANIKHIGDLVQLTEAEMLKTKNFGRKSIKEIKDRLEEIGLTLGMMT